ncbi:MAG: hypothetical protein HKP17_07755, partial [Ignavibacteriaceae bacterium]|nr:hypothetical protein [Ignavibacteriaceae bacterium]
LGFAFSAFAQTHVQSGSWSANTNTEGYTLSENQGDRSILVSVEFPEPFEVKPEVICGITLLDATSEKNVRYKIEVFSVSRDAMTIRISTWADTNIFGINGFWMAHAKGNMESDY